MLVLEVLIGEGAACKGAGTGHWICRIVQPQATIVLRQELAAKRCPHSAGSSSLLFIAARILRDVPACCLLHWVVGAGQTTGKAQRWVQPGASGGGPQHQPSVQAASRARCSAWRALTVDGLAAGAVARGEVAALQGSPQMRGCRTKVHVQQ